MCVDALAVAPACRDNLHRWLWVPAKAGTTRRCACRERRNLARRFQPLFGHSLIAKTEALHVRRSLRYGLLLCLSILYGPDLYPCRVLAPDLCAESFRGPDLCSRILHASELSVPLHGPDLRSGILYGLRLGILDGRYGSDLCPRSFVGRPSLELT